MSRHKNSSLELSASEIGRNDGISVSGGLARDYSSNRFDNSLASALSGLDRRRGQKDIARQRNESDYNDNPANVTDLLRQDFRELRREIDNIRRKNELRRIGSKEILDQELRVWERERSRKELAESSFERRRTRLESPSRRSSRSPVISPRNSTEKLLEQQKQLDREREYYLSVVDRQSPRRSRSPHRHSPSRYSPSRRNLISQDDYDSSVPALRESADRLSYQREKFEQEFASIRRRQNHRSFYPVSDGNENFLIPDSHKRRANLDNREPIAFGSGRRERRRDHFDLELGELREDNRRMKDELDDLRYKFSRDIELSRKEDEMQKLYREYAQYPQRKSPRRRELELSYEQGVYSGRTNFERGSPRRRASPRGSQGDDYLRSPRRSPARTELKEVKFRDPGSPHPPVTTEVSTENINDKISQLVRQVKRKVHNKLQENEKIAKYHNHASKSPNTKFSTYNPNFEAIDQSRSRGKKPVFTPNSAAFKKTAPQRTANLLHIGLATKSPGELKREVAQSQEASFISVTQRGSVNKR